MKQWGIEKHHRWKFVQIEFYVFFYFKSNSYVLYCLSDEKVRIGKKIIVEFLCKWISNVFFYFKSNSYVLYCLSNEKVRIWKIILQILLKSNSYAFFYLKSGVYVFYYFKFSSYVLFYIKSNSYHSYMCHIFAKGFLDSNFNSGIIGKILLFHEIASNFTYSQKS